MTLISRTDFRMLMELAGVGAPGASVENVALQISDATHEFCKTTGAWSQQTFMTTMPGVVEYAMAVPCPGAIVAFVAAAWYGGFPLKTRQQPYPAPVTAAMPDGGGSNGAGTPMELFVSQPNMVTVLPVPSGEFRIDLTLALAPTSPDAEPPVEFYNLWREAIMAGTMARLYAMPNLPHSTPAMAAYHAKRFRAQISDARATLARGMHRTFSPALPYPPPAVTGSKGARSW